LDFEISNLEHVAPTSGVGHACAPIDATLRRAITRAFDYHDIALLDHVQIGEIVLELRHDRPKVREQLFERCASRCDAPLRKVHLGVVVEEIEKRRVAVEPAQVFQCDRLALLVGHGGGVHGLPPIWMVGRVSNVAQCSVRK
jgi:hypothetical protein